MAAKPFQCPIIIRKEDIDQLGHVNNVVYLKWVQEAAAAHWNFIATPEMKKDHVWVVSRHEIDYLRSCFLESKLFATTWVGEIDGAKSERYVEIKDTETNKVIAKVKTVWTLLDAANKRPKRITEDFINLFR